MSKLNPFFKMNLFIGVMLSAFIYGSTYYVSTTGSDANSGTSVSPFKTIQKAAGIVKAGDKVIIKAGTYYERVIIKTSGTAASPIVFEGERGSKGEWLTIIHGTDAIPSNSWTQATEVGSGVWKTNAISYEVYSISEGDKFLWKIAKTYMDGKKEEYYIGKTGLELLAASAGSQLSSSYFGVPAVNLWDGIEALFGDASSGTTYIRYRNGDNPNSKTLRSSPFSAGIAIEDAGYITMRNLEVQGAFYAIRIKGALASNNIVEDCRLTNGGARVKIENGSSNIIRGNTIEMKMIGTEKYGPKAWVYDPANPYYGSVTTHLYFLQKFAVGASGGEVGGVDISGGTGNKICNNLIHRNDRGINLGGGDKSTRIYDNEIRWSARQGIYSGAVSTDLLLYSNLITEAGQYNIRINCHATSAVGPYYFYGNRFFHRADHRHNLSFQDFSGTGTFYSTIWIYHNSFSGGLETYGDRGDHPNIHTINNVASVQRLASGPQTPAVYDYNWGIGGGISGGSHNINGTTLIWPDSAEPPDYALPLTHRARNYGLDLSKQFAVQNKTYPALPGMTPGYFGSQRNPDLGAVQVGMSSILHEKHFAAPSFNQISFRAIPAGAVTNLVYFLPKPGKVQIDLCDVAGRLLRRFENVNQSAGEQTIFFNGKNTLGSALSSEIYFIRMRTGSDAFTGRIMAAR